MKPVLLLLCGIPASGKSTFAKSLQTHYTILSSDKIRSELGDVNDQSNNKKVFDILHERIREELLKGNSVIVDATNTKRQYRKIILEAVSDIDCFKLADVFLTDYQTCLERNAKRDRKVPEEVIQKMWNEFQFPSKEEGFGDIWYL